MEIADVFEDNLRPDPALALAPPQIPVRKRSGPMPRLQFVVEFVGPRSLPAREAVQLIGPPWYGGLGEPQVFAMSAAHVEWAPLESAASGSYDSVALAWHLISDKGQLSKGTAQHLLETAEQFAGHIQRRAMPMPLPEDVPKAIAQLKQVQANFDAGVSLLVMSNSRQVSEYELWIWCAQLGLTPNLHEGTFDWMAPSSPLPLFSVSPIGETESFTLEGAQRGDQHEGVLLGFSLPRSPEPKAGLEGMLKAAAHLGERMWGTVFDDGNRPLDDGGIRTMWQQVADAVDAMVRLGIPPGSPEAIRLFSPA